MDTERLAGKVRESIEILERFRTSLTVREVVGCPEIVAELVEIHGHALAVERLAKLTGVPDSFPPARVDA